MDELEPADLSSTQRAVLALAVRGATVRPRGLQRAREVIPTMQRYLSLHEHRLTATDAGRELWDAVIVWEKLRASV